MSLHNFSWVIPGKLAGSDMPGGGSIGESRLQDDIAFLADEGVKKLVSLARPTGSIEKVCAAAGMQWHYFPIPDFRVPDADGPFSNLVDECIHSFISGSPVCIHCHAGIGRTGMVLSCVVGAYLHLNAEKAVAMVQKTRAAIETEEQRLFTAAFLSAYES